MPKNGERAYSGTHNLTWNIDSKPGYGREKQHDLHGVLILDVDGTLTRPGSKYAIDSEAIDVLTEFIVRGGVCVFNTGATLGRLERTVFNQIFHNLDERHNNTLTASKIFQERIIAIPENGSATLLSRGVEIVESELYFLWHVLHPLHVPDKEKLRTLIEQELVPSRKNSFVIGDRPGDKNARQYILSWRGVTDTLKLIEDIKSRIVPKYPEIDWVNIEMKAARTTVDFIHAQSGKQPSIDWVLHEIGSLDGPVLGFGDLGDEFGKEVPTIDVNQGSPNEFRRRGVPAMELTHWEPLRGNRYVITGNDEKAIVRHSDTGEEINVLRDRSGKIIYAVKNENGYLAATINGTGHPVEIKPNPKTVHDAGKGTAWALRRLIDAGYFNIKKSFN